MQGRELLTVSEAEVLRKANEAFQAVRERIVVPEDLTTTSGV